MGETAGDPRERAAELAATADRLDELAEFAELMGDTDGALRFRQDGARCRERAMTALDHDPPEDERS